MADSPAPTPPRPPGRADWRRGASDAAGASNRGPLRAVALIALLGAAGGVVGMMFWFGRSTPPHLITVPGSDYTDSAWPANPWAEQDGKLLRSMVSVFPNSEEAFNFQERDRLVTKLESLKVASGQAVVVHLTALACTHKGDVFLLPGHADPTDPATWLPLTAVLDAFGACPAKNKLLLLDIAHPLANRFRGPLVDDVAEQLHAALTKAKPAFLVLTSCGPGEFSLPRDEGQSSAFAYYVVQGLTGAADRYNTAGASDEKVMARELMAFVRARVSRWAAQARGASQTPTPYGEADDFALTFKTQSAPETAGGAGDYPAALLDGWRRRDEARAAGAHQIAPATFAFLEASLLRAERGWRAGLPLKLDVSLIDAGRPADVPLRSLNAARAARGTPPPELVKALESYLSLRFADQPRKQDEVQTALAEFVAKATPQPVVAAKLIWDKLVSDLEPSEAKVTTLAEALDKIKPPASEEGLLLKRLAVNKFRAINWPRAEAHVLIEAENAAGRAFELLPGAFPWVQQAMEAADRTKRDGEQSFFDAKTTPSVQAAAERLVQARNAFTAIRKQLESIQSARRSLADAAVVLSGTAPGLIAGEVDENVWKAVADNATTLADVLTRGSEGQALPPSFDDQLIALQAGLRRLEVPFASETVKKQIAAASKSADVASYHALQGLLLGPLLNAAERKDVWKAAADVSRRLDEAALKKDTEDDAENRTTPAPPPAVPDANEPARAARRARVSLALLRLAGLDGGFDTARRIAASSSADVAAAAAELRDAWTKRRPDQFRQQMDEQKWPAADRLSWGPGLIGARPVEIVVVPPAVRLRAQEERACREWLEGHYVEYKQLRISVPGAVEMYEDARADCRR